jgi:cell division protein FtsA
MIEVPGIGERGARMLSKQLLSEVIEPRVEELYSLVQAELRRSGFEEQISSGIVLTGGSSQMKGMVELAEEVFHVPVRVGVPEYVGGLSERVRSPAYATGVGLLMAGLEKHELDEAAKIEAASFGQVMERMKSWFKNTF